MPSRRMRATRSARNSTPCGRTTRAASTNLKPGSWSSKRARRPLRQRHPLRPAQVDPGRRPGGRKLRPRAGVRHPFLPLLPPATRRRRKQPSSICAPRRMRNSVAPRRFGTSRTGPTTRIRLASGLRTSWKATSTSRDTSAPDTVAPTRAVRNAPLASRESPSIGWATRRRTTANWPLPRLSSAPGPSRPTTRGAIAALTARWPTRMSASHFSIPTTTTGRGPTPSSAFRRSGPRWPMSSPAPRK